jgi:hypothetical protein
MGISFSGTEDRALIKASSEWMGTPYRYGGVEKTGVDCSGFVLNVFREAYGVTLPRTSAAMARQVQRVSRDDLQSGDLLFFTVKDKRVSHVGIYMADNKFVHSSSSYGVSVASLGDAYWSRYFAGAGRVDVEEAQVQQEPAADSVQRENRAAAHRRTSSLPNRRSRTNGQDTPAKPDEASAADTASAAADKDDDVILVFDEEF